MINRRQFVFRTGSTLSALAISPAAAFADQLNAIFALSNTLDRELAGQSIGTAPGLIAGDEKFWARVRNAYRLNPDVINLDHGWTRAPYYAERLHDARRARSAGRGIKGRLDLTSLTTSSRTGRLNSGMDPTPK